MKIIDFENLKEKVKDDLVFNDSTLKSENENNSSKLHYYLTLLYQEKDKLFELESMQKKLFAELMKFYKWGENEKIYPKKKFERIVKNEDVKVLIEADSKWQKFQKIFKKQLMIVEYLEKVVKLFESRHFSLSNAIKLYEKEKGLVI